MPLLKKRSNTNILRKSPLATAGRVTSRGVEQKLRRRGRLFREPNAIKGGAAGAAAGGGMGAALGAGLGAAVGAAIMGSVGGDAKDGAKLGAKAGAVMGAAQGVKHGAVCGAVIGDARGREETEEAHRQEAMRRAELYRQQQEALYHQQYASTYAASGNETAMPHDQSVPNTTLPPPVYGPAQNTPLPRPLYQPHSTPQYHANTVPPTYGDAM